MNDQLRDLAISLYKIDCFLFGKIKLSSEITINAYFDLAVIFSHPKILNKMCNAACEFIKKTGLQSPNICGVSYTGIPFAVLVANKLKVPLLIRNKEINLCGSDRRIEGNIIENSEVLIIEEVMCSGTSTLQVIKDIEDAGMVVKNILVMVDLEQGGHENLHKLGYKTHSLLKLSEIGDILYKEGYINEDRLEDIRKGWIEHFVPNGDCITNTKLAERISTKFESRFEHMKSKVSQRLLQIISKKETNICADLTLKDMDELILTANEIGPYICILCIHLSGYEEIKPSQIHELKKIASKHNFLLMDDRKLSEVGDVLRYQLKKAFSIVDLVSLLPLPGENVFKELNSIRDVMQGKGVFLRGCSFTEDSFIKAPLEKSVIELGLSQCESLVGFITHQNSKIPIEYVHMMSDIRSTGSTAGKTKNNYYSPNMMTERLGADVVMLFFSDNSNILESVLKEQKLSWAGYESRFSNDLKFSK